ncbi:hypothetical protein AB0M49_35530, partial [Streptomyces sp. NPDC051577]
VQRSGPRITHTTGIPQGSRTVTTRRQPEILSNNSATAPAEATAETEPGSLLTAVNNHAGRPAAPLPHQVDESAQTLRQYLVATPGEQADNIVRVLSPEELVGLVEELQQDLNCYATHGEGRTAQVVRPSPYGASSGRGANP